MRILLFWSWLHAKWIIRRLPEDHPWKTMTFKEYVDTADAQRIQLALNYWGILGLLLWYFGCFGP